VAVDPGDELPRQEVLEIGISEQFGSATVLARIDVAWVDKDGHHRLDASIRDKVIEYDGQCTHRRVGILVTVRHIENGQVLELFVAGWCVYLDALGIAQVLAVEYEGGAQCSLGGPQTRHCRLWIDIVRHHQDRIQLEAVELGQRIERVGALLSVDSQLVVEARVAGKPALCSPYTGVPHRLSHQRLTSLPDGEVTDPFHGGCRPPVEEDRSIPENQRHLAEGRDLPPEDIGLGDRCDCLHSSLEVRQGAEGKAPQFSCSVEVGLRAVDFRTSLQR